MAQTEKLGRPTTHSVKPATHRYDGLFNLNLASYPGVYRKKKLNL